MAKETILVVEDEPDILELIRFNLEREGYETVLCESGEDGLEAVKTHRPDLILLDLMLPGLDGKSVCRKLKEDGNTRSIPVIMVTARGEESDIITGLELGADDYVTKPFSPKILTARIGAVLRRVEDHGVRTEGDDSEVLEVHDLSIHTGRHEIRAGDVVIDVSSTEFGILKFLASRPGWVFTRRQILRGVHGEDHPVLDRSIDVQIASLRKKLGVHGGLIETVRGVGYRFAE